MIEDRIIVRPNKIIHYRHFTNRIKLHLLPLQKKTAEIEANEEKEPSIESRKKLSNCLNNLYAISDNKRVYDRKSKKGFSFKLNFITLTLSSQQKHSDNYMKRKMLEPYLKWMQYNHSMNSYVWKAETQANGNIHFHITTNIFIHYKAIRNCWNSIQYKHGYIGAEWSMIDDDVPNSTDVHSVKDAKACIDYLANYMLKHKKGRRIITGQIWNSSLNLKQSPPNLLNTEVLDIKTYVEWNEKCSNNYFHNEHVEIDFTNHEKNLLLPVKLREPYMRWISFMKRNEPKNKSYYLN